MAQQTVPLERTSSRRDYTWHVLSSIVPMIMLATFSYVHIQYWIDEGDFKGLGLALQEGLLVGLFLIRRRPKESLNDVGAWIAAIVGSFGALLVRPDADALFNLGSLYAAIALFGAALAVASTVFLGRSFGIVAANRGVKTSGAYRLVRHPIYASYLVGYVAYLLASFSAWNVLIIAITVAFQFRRITAEESVLMRDPAYQEYAGRVRYRLIPGVF